MRSSELIDFLEHPERLVALKQAIAGPLAVYRNAIKIRGASAPVELTTENRASLVMAIHVKRLCDWYLAEAFDEVEVEYIATALALCPDFVAESEDVQNAIYSLSDLRQLKPHERERANEILDSLR